MTWREGSADQLSSRFARVRVRVGYNKLIPEKLSPEWLLIEWPEGEAEPTKYWLSTLPENVSFTQLVDLAKLRWRSSATIKSSSRRSDSVITKAAAGVVSIIAQPCASRPTVSSSPNRRRFPPQDLVPPRQSRFLPYPTIIDPEDLPLRPERHVPNAIATMRVRLSRALSKTIVQCPCCGAIAGSPTRRKFITQ